MLFCSWYWSAPLVPVLFMIAMGIMMGIASKVAIAKPAASRGMKGDGARGSALTGLAGAAAATDSTSGILAAVVLTRADALCKASVVAPGWGAPVSCSPAALAQ